MIFRYIQRKHIYNYNDGKTLKVDMKADQIMLFLIVYGKQYVYGCETMNKHTKLQKMCYINK